MIGIQAIGGIFRIKSNTGRSVVSMGSHQAITTPSGTPIHAPKQKPSRETRRLEKMWVGSVAPSGFFVVHFAMPVSSAVTGEGKRVAGASLSTSVTRYHKRKKRHNESADMSLSLMARSFFCCKVIISSISG